LKFRKFKKNAKALSPVIATIILIAVTVAVSVVVAAWMGALTIGFMGNSEQVSATNTVLTNAGVATTGAVAGGTDSIAVVTVQNTGSGTVNIASATIDGNSATITFATSHGWASGDQAAIPKGGSVDVTVQLPSGTFADSAQYTIKLQTAKGNSITTQASYNGS